VQQCKNGHVHRRGIYVHREGDRYSLGSTPWQVITDQETNFVYLSDLLEKKCPEVLRQLLYHFERLKINYGFLQGTKDLWVVDFMPLQVRKDYFLQYAYNPDYLKPRKYSSTKSNSEAMCDIIGIVPNRVSIVLDGGNIVKHKKKVILTTKVLKENPDYPEQNLIAEIKNQLQVEQVIVIPQEPRDFVGHADSMVKFIDENTVLVNSYPKNKTYTEFGFSLRACLRNAGLYIVELPYTSWQNPDANDATGCYVNFFEVGNYIFYPVFAQLSDQITEIVLQNHFKGRELVDIDCRDLAKLGGVLNCATWNIWTS
jgi:agmatine deiminase